MGQPTEEEAATATLTGEMDNGGNASDEGARDDVNGNQDTKSFGSTDDADKLLADKSGATVTAEADAEAERASSSHKDTSSSTPVPSTSPEPAMCKIDAISTVETGTSAYTTPSGASHDPDASKMNAEKDQQREDPLGIAESEKGAGSVDVSSESPQTDAMEAKLEPHGGVDQHDVGDGELSDHDFVTILPDFDPDEEPEALQNPACRSDSENAFESQPLTTSARRPSESGGAAKPERRGSKMRNILTGGRRLKGKRSGSSKGRGASSSHSISESPTPPSKAFHDGIVAKSAQKDSSQHAVSSSVLGLPIDSLHTIASYLHPREWAMFGQSNKQAHKVCRDIFRRVRLHGFRCATEVITAWKLGQHGDAKELVALYVEAGVPIYPYSFGHSYHTLIWKMGIETNEMQGPTNGVEDDVDEDEITDTFTFDRDLSGDHDMAPRRRADRFYSERYDARSNEEYSETLTYLEEKSSFWLNIEAENAPPGDINAMIRRQLSLTPNRLSTRRSLSGNAQSPARGAVGPPMRLPSFQFPSRASFAEPSRGVNRSSSFCHSLPPGPKVNVKIHRHLLDQHLLGRPAIDDCEGCMNTASFSMSADFFHPHFAMRTTYARHPYAIADEATADFSLTRGLLPAWDNRLSNPYATADSMDFSGSTDGGESFASMPVAPSAPGAGPASSDGDNESANFTGNDTTYDSLALGGTTNDEVAILPRVLSYGQSPVCTPSAYPGSHSILSDVDLDVYSASNLASMKVKGDTSVNGSGMRSHLQARFSSYQQRLEVMLNEGGSNEFDECLMDMWDEFFPRTADIHYHDRHTPVPRTSRLEKFLTTPCPKSLGIIQCEIQRIKLHSKKKGERVKDRLFPAYEYRLFIRHRPVDNGDNQERPRQDSLLMVAKNRGRKHSDSSGKKRANNYFLYLPKQEDVIEHFMSVNDAAKVTSKSPCQSCKLYRSPTLLSRLQSNMLGTEFQIYVPRNQKRPVFAPRDNLNQKYPASISGMSSEDELDYEGGFSSDTGSTSRRKSRRFGRLSFRRSSTNAERGVGNASAPSSVPIELRRTRSSPDLPNKSNGNKRPNRRAIANTADLGDHEHQQEHFYEEEDGVITYTANLLGSRPRIMDVCVPRIEEDGVTGEQWKKHAESRPEEERNSPNLMLNHFKQLQQRSDNTGADHNPAGGQVNGNNSGSNGANGDNSDFGLLSLQNRPPWWNVELGSFVLNFGGRVSVASVKNFQLCDRAGDDQDYVMLQFGRIQGRHSFTMDFQYPLTATQAFAIAISSLQSKISFG